MRLIWIAFLMLGGARAGHAECPANTVNILDDTYTTSAPRDEAYRNISGCWPDAPNVCWLREGWVNYDLVAGTLVVQANGANTSPAVVSVSSHDVFTLLGPSSSLPITFTARARVETYAFQCGSNQSAASASIREGTSNTAAASHVHCGGLIARDIQITITRRVGAMFDLFMTGAVQAGLNIPGTSWQAFASMRLTFLDLPAGYSVVSCQGYSSAPVVPTARGSWGALKTLYR